MQKRSLDDVSLCREAIHDSTSKCHFERSEESHFISESGDSSVASLHQNDSSQTFWTITQPQPDSSDCREAIHDSMSDSAAIYFFGKNFLTIPDFQTR